jgi:alpha-tubulin suppressor-like RCC1 family protein
VLIVVPEDRVIAHADRDVLAPVDIDVDARGVKAVDRIGGAARRWGQPLTRASLVAVVFGMSAVVTMLGPVGALGEQASEPGSPAAGQLDIGANFSCAIVTGGQVRCWGYGGEGELGVPGVTTVGAGDTPASVGPVDLGAGFTATAISSGDYHTCAIRNDGSVVCWGYGANGRLGYGNTNNVGDSQTPGSAGPVDLGAGFTATAISSGDLHTCAIRNDGSVVCWGFGLDGQLGYGNPKPVGDSPGNIPSAAGPVDLGAGRRAVAISAGSLHTCAILDDGSVRCWGDGGNGRLGYGNTNTVGDAVTPGSVGPVKLGAGHTAEAISAGGSHTCAILNDGTVRCWGFGLDGQLGYGNENNAGDTSADTPDLLPPVNLGAGRTAIAISTGSAHTCAILDNASVLCWGYGLDGRLGYGNTSNVGDTPSATPGLIGPVNLGAGRTAGAISAGNKHTCARVDDGSVRCWGYGGNGRLGYCSETNVGDTPATIPGTAGPVNLVPGDGGELCATPPPVPTVPVNVSPPSTSGQTIAGQTLTEANGSWSPTPTDYAYQWERCDTAGNNCGAITGAAAQAYTLGANDIGSTIRVQETASDAGGSASAASAPTAIIQAAPGPNPDTAREQGWRTCLAAVSTRARHTSALTHRGSKRQRAQTRRRLARQLANGRQHCEKTWGRTPGPVTGLQAITRGKTKIELDFTAPGTDGNKPPAATSYLVKQSSRPIRTRRDFTTAQALCEGACRFTVTSVGAKITLMITALDAQTTYYYAIAALDNVTARPGPRTSAINATTA